MGLLQSLPLCSKAMCCQPSHFLPETIFLSWVSCPQLKNQDPIMLHLKKRKGIFQELYISSRYFLSHPPFTTKLYQKMFTLTSFPSSALIYSSIYNSIAPALAKIFSDNHLLLVEHCGLFPVLIILVFFADHPPSPF